MSLRVDMLHVSIVGVKVYSTYFQNFVLRYRVITGHHMLPASSVGLPAMLVLPGWLPQGIPWCQVAIGARAPSGPR